MITTFSCQTRTLTWISASCANFIAFCLLIWFITKTHAQLSNRDRVKMRYDMSVLMTFCFIPFMAFINIWGSLTFKSKQFLTLNKKEKYDPHDPDVLCKLNSYYQLLGIVYMLLIYCEQIIYIVISCVMITNIKRFYFITDDKTREEQRLLTRIEGGRKYPLCNRTKSDQLCAFEYAYFML
jgi:hypothetical protein